MSFDTGRSSLKGEAQRIVAKSAQLPSCESSLKTLRHLVLMKVFKNATGNGNEDLSNDTSFSQIHLWQLWMRIRSDPCTLPDLHPEPADPNSDIGYYVVNINTVEVLQILIVIE